MVCTSAQKKELDDAWRIIPKKITDGISTLKFRAGDNILGAGGRYTLNDTSLNMSVGGAGVSSVLHHEVHHHMWWTKRTPERLSKWTDGVKKIMEKYKQSPTKYSDSYGKVKGVAKLKKIESKISKYWAALDTGEFTIEQCIPEYQEKKKMLESHKRWLTKAYRSVDDNDLVIRRESRIKRAE